MIPKWFLGWGGRGRDWGMNAEGAERTEKTGAFAMGGFHAEPLRSGETAEKKRNRFHPPRRRDAETNNDPKMVPRVGRSWA